MIGANKQDIENSLPPDDVRLLLEIPENIPVLPVVSLDKSSVISVIRVLIREIEKKEMLQHTHSLL